MDFPRRIALFCCDSITISSLSLLLTNYIEEGAVLVATVDVI